MNATYTKNCLWLNNLISKVLLKGCACSFQNWRRLRPAIAQTGHDTLGVIVRDSKGKLSAGKFVIFKQWQIWREGGTGGTPLHFC